MSADAGSGWYFTLVGWPFWVVLPLAAGGWVALRRLARFELAERSERQRKGLLLLRGTAVALMLLLFLEPIFSRRLVSERLPVVSVLIDTSGSMAVRDTGMAASQRLDEAMALGLVSADVREAALGGAARRLEEIGEELPALVELLGPAAPPPSGKARPAERRRQASRRCAIYARDLAGIAPRLAGQASVGKDVAELVRLLERSSAVLSGSDPGAGKLREALRGFQSKVPALVARCRAAQRAADAAMVAAAGPDSPVVRGLERLDALSRHQRVRMLAEHKLLPLFKGRAQARFVQLRKDLAPLAAGNGESAVRPEGGTDFAGPLTSLAQSSGGDRLGAVLVLSDGRQTSGGDPAPALRALRARGVRVGAVVVGDPAEPRDAVVAEIIGSREVFQNETVRLDVRFRIVGYQGVPWDLVLSRGGEVLERRRVKGNARWQSERFEVPAGEPGLLQFQARLEMDRRAAVAALAGAIAHWSCDEGKGLELRDGVDGETGGRLQSADPAGAWREGKVGKALRLRPNEHVVIPAQPKLGESWSFTGWFLAPLLAGTKGSVLLRGRSRDFQVMADKDGQLGTWVSGKGSFRSCGFNLKGLKRGWHHLAAVGQGGTTTFYIDGLRVGSCNVKSTGDLYAIGNGGYGGQLFSAGLDEMRLHNRALNHVEVKWMMDLSAAGREETGYLLREVWRNVAGETIAHLTGSDRYAREADRQERIEALEVAPGAEARCGARVRGYLLPPQSGSYTFMISADDSAELWLSTGRDPARKTLLASVKGPVPAGTWDRQAGQTSKPVVLRAGERYYLEVLHKQAQGQGHLSVGWKRPDGKVQKAIPGARLMPDLPGGRRTGDPGALLREASADNNQADLMVSVNRDPLRVLLVDAYPRWESRYLMTMLERDRRVKLVRRYRAVRVPRGELELLPEKQEELDRYAMVIFGDLMPKELRSGDQKRLADFVARRGGFLVLLAGPRGLPGRYSLGGVADLLPVKAAAGTGGKQRRPDDPGIAGGSQRARLRLTGRGEKHALMAVLDDPALNRKLWPALPGLTWIARNLTAKAGAEVLLETDDPQRTPVVAMSRFGAGRVLYLGTDESWRWRDRLGDRIHQTFWLQAVRWGLGLRLRGKDSRLQVALARSMITPEEETELRARAVGPDGKPLEVRLVVRLGRLDEKNQVVPESARHLEMTPVPDGAGIHQLRLAGLSEGRWRLRTAAEGGALEGLSEVRELLVQRQPGREGIELGASPATMRRLAELGGHRAGDFGEAQAVVESLLEGLKPRRVREVSTHSLWDNYLILIAAVGLLLTEWLWRKRQGLP